MDSGRIKLMNEKSRSSRHVSPLLEKEKTMMMKPDHKNLENFSSLCCILLSYWYCIYFKVLSVYIVDYLYKGSDRMMRDWSFKAYKKLLWCLKCIAINLQCMFKTHFQLSYHKVFIVFSQKDVIEYIFSHNATMKWNEIKWNEISQLDFNIKD